MSEDDLPRTRLRTAAQHLLTQPQLRSRGSGRGTPSRSPSPAPPGIQAFVYPPQQPVNDEAAETDKSDTFEDAMPSETVDIAELQRIAKVAADAAAAASQALIAMTTHLAASNADNARLRAHKKPDLPNFEPKDIEVWIRRIESAFTRVGVDTTKDKFAFLEAKFPVDYDPKINDFLFGPLDPDPWTPFVTYLRKRYGRTKQQQSATFINGPQRDGRLPSQAMAVFKSQTKDISMDDVYKEFLLRMLPVDVKRAIAQESKELDAEQTAELADTYFAQDGRPLYPAATSVINAVDGVPNHSSTTMRPGGRPDQGIPGPSGTSNDYTVAFDLSNDCGACSIDNAPVNYVNPPQGNGARPRQTSRQPQPQQRDTNGRRSTQPRAQSSSRYGPKFDENGLCSFHRRFGAKAYQCVTGCTHRNSAAILAGNARAGQR